MLNWLKRIFKKKNKVASPGCHSCVFWKSEEENNAQFINANFRYCDIHKKHTFGHKKCDSYVEERFEATSESIQTEELEINHDLSIEGSSQNDTRGEK